MTEVIRGEKKRNSLAAKGPPREDLGPKITVPFTPAEAVPTPSEIRDAEPYQAPVKPLTIVPLIDCKVAHGPYLIAFHKDVPAVVEPAVLLLLESSGAPFKRV